MGDVLVVNNIESNRLANKLATENLSSREYQYTFSDLVLQLETMIDCLVNEFVKYNGLNSYNLDKANYLSVIYSNLSKAIDGYEIERGNFTGRLRFYSRYWLQSQLKYELASKRVGDLYPLSLGDITEEKLSLDYKDLTSEPLMLNQLIQLINNFVDSDKDGEIIKVLWVTAGQGRIVTIQALSNLLGGYNGKERKKVSRVRTRLKKVVEKFCY